MLTLNFANHYAIDPAHGMPKSTFADHAEYLSPSLEKIHARGQGFYTVIDDQTVDQDQYHYSTVRADRCP